MRSVPIASKKFGRSGLAIESRLLPLLEDELRGSVRTEEPEGWRRDDAAVEGIALDEKLRRLFSGAGSLGLVLLRLR